MVQVTRVNFQTRTVHETVFLHACQASTLSNVEPTSLYDIKQQALQITPLVHLPYLESEFDDLIV